VRTRQIMREDTLTGPPIAPDIAARSGETLVELLDLAVARSPGDQVFVMPRGSELERWTYEDLGKASRQAAATLAARGVRSGDRVVTWAANDPWLVAAYFGVWRLGAVIVPLDLRMAPDVAVRIGRAAEPVLTLAGSDVPASSAAALGVPVLGVDAAALTAAPLGQLPSPPAPSDLAEVLFTSGTTSDPKGVTLTHRQLIHSGRTIAMTAGVRRERALALLPLSHMYGQIVPLFYGFMCSCQLTFLPSLTPSALLTAMKRDRITVLTAVPALLRLLMDGVEAEAARTGRSGQLRRVRQVSGHLPMRARRLLCRSILARFGGELATITCGGALLPPELQRAWEAMGVAVVQGYGATECASIAGHTRKSRRPGTVGPPLAGIEVRIAADGELLARGPNMMSGYWGKPELTAQTLADGWAHSGDAAEIDRHGEIVIRGRTRDRIALPNGLKVYPEDVESVLAASDAISAAVVIEAEPGRLAAILIPAGGADDKALEAAVKQANGNLSPQQRIRRWVRWEAADFPRTHTLKVRRDEVKASYSTHSGEDLALGESNP
jgi:long-chain acyl-CoA synthetase